MNSKDEDYNIIRDLLNKKYNIELRKRKAEDVYVVRSYEDMLSQLVKYNEKLNFYKDTGIFEFVVVREYAFTLDVYQENYKEFENVPVITCSTL